MVTIIHSRSMDEEKAKGNADLLDGLGQDDTSQVGIGVHIITHHNFGAATHEVSLHSSGLHPTDLRKLQATINGLLTKGWTLHQLKLVVTQGIGGAWMLAVLARPRS